MGNAGSKERSEMAERTFRYLKSLCEEKQRTVLSLEKQKWALPLSSLSEGFGLAIPFEAEKNPYDRPILRIRRPESEPCPEPPDALAGWLKDGWDRAEASSSAVKVKMARREHGESGEIVRFDDSASRVSKLSEWTGARDAWLARQERIDRTQELFVKLREIKDDLLRDSESQELLFGSGYLKDLSDGTIGHPVLLQRARIGFDALANEITLETSDAGPFLYSSLFAKMEDVDPRSLKAAEEELANACIHPFDPERAIPFLKRLLHSLHAQSRFVEESTKGLDLKGVRLLMDYRPTIFLGRKTDGTSRAIERILADMENGGELPFHIRQIVERLADGQPSPKPDPDGIEKLAMVGGESRDILLSKEANQEQLEIATAVEEHSAVVVQGPPGTGKSHTIANLMGHLLAQGKTVLVTSQKTKALSVLKDKLPDEIRDLCVSMLDDGYADMEASVERIENFIAGSTRARLEAAESAASERREKVLDALAETRRKILSTKCEERKSIVQLGKAWSPADAARYVKETAEELGGLIPGPVAASGPLPLSEDEIAFLYRSNAEISSEEEASLSCLPDPSALLSEAEFEEAVSSLGKVEEEVGDILARKGWKIRWLDAGDASVCLQDDGGSIEIHPASQSVTDALMGYAEGFAPVTEWQVSALADGLAGGGYLAPWKGLIRSIENADALSQEYARQAKGRQVSVSPSLIGEGLLPALEKLEISFERNGKLGLLERLGKGREILEKARVDGRKVSSADDCRTVRAFVELLRARCQCQEAWDGRMASGGAPAFDNLDPERPESIAALYAPSIKGLLYWQEGVQETLSQLLADCGLPRTRPRGRFESYRDYARRILTDLTEEVPDMCRLSACLGKRASALREIEKCKTALANGGEGKLRTEMLSSVESKDAVGYRSAMRSFQALLEKSPALAERRRLLGKIRDVAPEWAEQVDARAGRHGEAEVPKGLKSAWEWKQLASALERANAVDTSGLQAEAAALALQYRRVTAEVAARRAWLSLFVRAGESVELRQSLSSWSGEMRKVGKGTGKHAAEHKARARRLMPGCKEAIPAWIMPMDKALESFGPESGKFDVVIVDEASQSDVSALAIACFARKLIIVGDDKQVSPLHVGMDKGRVAASAEAFLGDLGLASLLDPDNSLYDVASSTFETIRLKEHFRCVPDIIEFCNSLSYGGEIKPLRDPGSTDLRPSVVSHRAKFGHRGRNGKNLGEAREIVCLIKACMAQPEYEGKTFGVISLHSSGSQARLIQGLVSREIEGGQIDSRRIVCGNPADFQGDERDVVFLSMVESCEGEGPASLETGDGSSGMIKKRYNVAVSRAKDQIWVVHSLDPAKDLKPNDIRRRLLEYANDPASKKRKNEKVELFAESPFEEAVGKSLVSRNYRISQQWEVGPYRIDIVVSYGNKKVAIECDGERYHTDFLKDLERQIVLERAGWTFIRIRGGEYYREPEATMERVFAELERRGIKPEGPDEDAAPSNPDSDLLERVRAEAETLLMAWQERDPVSPGREGAIAYALGTREGDEEEAAVPHRRDDGADIAEKHGNPSPAEPADKTQQQDTLEPTRSARPRAFAPASEASANEAQRAKSPRAEDSHRSEEEPILAAMREKGLAFVDGRPEGLLWIEDDGTAELNFLIKDLEKGFDVKFHHREHGGRGFEGRPGYCMQGDPKGSAAVRGRAGRARKGKEEGRGAKPACNAPSSTSRSVQGSSAPVRLPYTPLPSVGDYDSPDYRQEVEKRMSAVIESEAPIEKQRLFNKVRESFGVAKSGSYINAHNERVLKSMDAPVTEFNGHEYVWRKDQNPREYESYRANGASFSRDIAEIPYEEIQAAIVQSLLENRGHANVKALRRMVLHHLGFSKLGRVIRETLDLAMDEALARGVVETRAESVISLPKRDDG